MLKEGKNFFLPTWKVGVTIFVIILKANHQFFLQLSLSNESAQASLTIVFDISWI